MEHSLRGNSLERQPVGKSLCFTGQERAWGRAVSWGEVKERRDHSGGIWKVKSTGPGVRCKWWAEDWVGLRSR